ncbi:DnaJ domain-containing protein [Pseudonocardia alni]|uniref:DnaJ domain-containing protein n=1 Tax=Pseudonocardia alni TaxID=33907 RepID=UPI0036C1AC50
MTGRVTVERASALLGLAPGAGPDAVRAAFRRRAQEVHPDRPNGSAAAFREVAAARDVLLGVDAPAGWGSEPHANEQPWPPWSEASERNPWGYEEPRRGSTSATRPSRPVITPTAPAWRVHLPVLGGGLAVAAAALLLSVLMSNALFAIPIVVAAVLVAVMTGWSAVGRLRRVPAGRMVFSDDSDA